MQDLKKWWSVQTEIGPKFGYYPKPTKVWLVVKPCASEKVKSVHFVTKIKITTEGRRYREGSADTRKFKDLYITTKVTEWISQLELLSKIAYYCAFTADFKHKVTCTMSTIPDICQHLQKLDQYVKEGYISNNVERKWLSLPVKLGCMGVVIFADVAKTEYQNSRNITES